MVEQPEAAAAAVPRSAARGNRPLALLAVSGGAALALAGAPGTARVGVAFALNSALAALGVVRGQAVLTAAGLAHSWALGVMLWSALGWRGWSTCVLYLVLGSAVTKLGRKKKEALGIAEGRGGRRGPENVWGSAATAAICALAAAGAASPGAAALWRVGFVAALASKLADTCQSEVGKAYGRTTYLITTLARVPAGTEGAVSAEGTAAGVVGSFALAGYAVACGLVGAPALLPCLLAAFVATTAESLIGASAQDRFRLLTNEVVNWLLTVIGAAAGIGLALLCGAA